MNIDWELFKIQKEGLFALVMDARLQQEEVDVLDGVIHLMDAIQDEFKPLEVEEESEVLISKYGYWKGHPDYPVEDWRCEIENNDTRIGYWDWVAAQMNEG